VSLLKVMGTGMLRLRMARMASSGRRAVVNLSWGGSASPTLVAAIARLASAGAVVVAAAGNDSIDACATSPANAPGALAVGSAAIDDSLSSFSNYGPCVGVVAPGEYVVGASYTSDNGYVRMSGTSMASPLAAGTAAVALQLDPTASAAAVRARIVCGATRGAVHDAPPPPAAPTTTKLLFSDPSRWDSTSCAVSSGAARATPPPAALALLAVAVAHALRARWGR
jgi:subtilisin family serine protease